MKLGGSLLVLIVVGVGGWYFLMPKTQTPPQSKQTSPYVNEQYGFEISYPMTSKTYSANCKSYETNKEARVPVKIIEDVANNAVYVANSEFVEVKNKFMGDGTYKYDFSTCKTVPTSLKLIKSGFQNGLPQKMGGTTYPVALKFSYSRATDDKELARFGEKGLGVKECQIASKEYVKGSTNTYKIRLRGQGAAGEMGGSCFLNADYQFVYSPTTKTAVISGGYQNCIFGPGKICVPEVKIIN